MYRIQSRLSLAGLACLLIITTPGCSHNPVRFLEGESISIVSADQTSKVDTHVNSKAASTGKSAVTGTLGAAGGAAISAASGFGAGFVCGPLFLICSPVAALGMGIAGAGGWQLRRPVSRPAA